MKKQNNTQILQINEVRDFTIIKNNLIDDMRLKPLEKAVLIMLIRHTDFYISTRATAKYFNISDKTLRNVLINLKSLGYLSILKDANTYKYVINQNNKYIPDFKPYLIDTYTNAQLNALLNNNETPQRWKNLIKKYFDALSQDESTYLNVLSEIKEIDTPKDILKDKQEQEKEQDIIKYLK